jgi:hypothetical protein
LQVDEVEGDGLQELIITENLEVIQLLELETLEIIHLDE